MMMLTYILEIPSDQPLVVANMKEDIGIEGVKFGSLGVNENKRGSGQ